jgi:hypothetical protein
MRLLSKIHPHRSAVAGVTLPAHTLTPTSSFWLNLVERWFAKFTDLNSRQSAHRSVTELEADIRI